MYTVLYDSTNDVLAIYSNKILIPNTDDFFLVIQGKDSYTNIVKNASNYINNIYDIKHIIFKHHGHNTYNRKNYIAPEFINLCYTPINLGNIIISGILGKLDHSESKLSFIYPKKYDIAKRFRDSNKNLLDIYAFYNHTDYTTGSLFYYTSIDTIALNPNSNIDLKDKYYVDYKSVKIRQNITTVGNEIFYNLDEDNELYNNQINIYYEELQYNNFYTININSNPLIPINIPIKFKLKSADIFFIK